MLRYGQPYFLFHLSSEKQTPCTLMPSAGLWMESWATRELLSCATGSHTESTWIYLRTKAAQVHFLAELQFL